MKRPGWYVHQSPETLRVESTLAGPFSSLYDANVARNSYKQNGFRDLLWIEEIKESIVPSEPTLGWLEVTERAATMGGTDTKILGFFKSTATGADGGPAGIWSDEYVVGFTPATAVSSDSLLRLEDKFDKARHMWQLTNAVAEFLDELG